MKRDIGLLLAFVLMIAGIGIVGVVWALRERTSVESACTKLEGVPVKPHLGPVVCIDREAVIEVPR